MGDALTELDARELSDAVRRGETSATAIVQAHHRAMDRGADLQAWLCRTDDAALAHAARIDDARDRGGPLGRLAGVPIGLKDLFVTRGIPTTAGSRILSGWIPPYQGEHARRVDDADMVLLGKLSLDEFAMGSSNENVVGEPVRNPWARDRVAGGSSGGAAAAVAARMIPVALGSDTGGSIRQPAACCGVVGLKPTYGRVTRSGMIAFASSLDQAGPITRSVRDAAAVLEILAGRSDGDSTCVDAPVPDFVAACERGAKGLRIGVHRRSLDADGLDDDVRARFLEALALLCDRGATLVDVELPHAALGIATYYVLCAAEAASNLARYDGVRYGARVAAASVEASIEASRSAGFGPEVRRRILLGTFVLRAESYEAYYGRAARVRRLVADDHTRAFAGCDVIATPTAPQPAFRLGERNADPLAMYLGDIFTVGANLAGLPAISIPCGFTRPDRTPRLPIGLQLVGPAWREDAVLAAAAAHEDGSAWHRERPPIAADETSPASEPST